MFVSLSRSFIQIIKNEIPIYSNVYVVFRYLNDVSKKCNEFAFYTYTWFYSIIYIIQARNETGRNFTHRFNRSEQDFEGEGNDQWAQRQREGK